MEQPFSNQTLGRFLNDNSPHSWTKVPEEGRDLLLLTDKVWLDRLVDLGAVGRQQLQCGQPLLNIRDIGIDSEEQ